MITQRELCFSLVTAALTFSAGMVAPPVAQADDTEVFFVPVANSDKPNILFVIDSGQTMGELVGQSATWKASTDWEEVAKAEFDVSVDCDEKKLYWTAGSLPITTDSSGAKTVDCAAMPYIDFDLANYDDPNQNKFVCRTALDLFRSSSSVGYVTQGLIAQYDNTNSTVSRRAWKKMQGLANNGSISLGATKPDWITECLADDDTHGINDASAAGDRPNDKSESGFGTNSTTKNSVYSSAKGVFDGSFTFYTANRIAFEVVKANSLPTTSTQTRLEAVQFALESLVNSVSGVRIGLMRFDNNAGASKGGMVVQEMTDIDSGKAEILDTVFVREVCNKNKPDECQKIFVPADKKSIGETLWEAYRYYAGAGVDFGLATNLTPNIPFPSVPDSMVNPTSSQPNYKSPVTSCGKNYIILLTDGLTEQDNSKDGQNAIAGLPNFQYTPEIRDYATSNAKCDVEEIKAGATSSDCVDDLPAWMFRNDVNTSVAGTQNVKTYTVGFDLGSEQLDLAARSVLRDAARRGGGKYYDATDQNSLEDAFNETVREILVDNASFTAPSVAVNAFNRTQNLNDLYMSVFKPAFGYRWLGNIKKYKLTPEGDIVDAKGKPAIDVSTGFFAAGTQSFWSSDVDGPDASLGGAASKLVLPDASTNPRTIYTNVSSSGGTLSVFDSGTLSTQISVLKGGDSTTEAFANNLLFKVVAPATPPTGSTSRDELIDWAYGIDTQDRVGASGTNTDPRYDMGDPLHARPATVVYDGPADAPDTTLYTTTNDGMLHAIDAKTGLELWAFLPTELLPRLQPLFTDDGVTDRVYGLDGSVKTYRIDNDQDGKIETADDDRVYLFFGMRRGGSHLYAMDVSNRESPKLLWRAGGEDESGLGGITTSSDNYLPGIGQSWSVPTITRMNIDRSWGSNDKKLVAVFGGGYNPDVHDKPLPQAYLDDDKGNRVYIIDALTGELIWRAGPSGDSGAQLQLSDMKSAIPGEIRSFDLTGDGYDDRMYAADLGGRIWRFDIANGETPSELVSGGVFAALGTTTDGTTNSSVRKFFYAPDASLVRYGGRSWINIAIGSGNREFPVSDMFPVQKSTVVDNRFYSLRDYNIFPTVPTDKYLSSCTNETGPCHQVITASDTRVTDVTTDLTPSIATTSVGWYIELAEAGEKALAESRTFNNALYFTTYTPRERNSGLTCGLAVGISKLYVVNAVNAKPVFDYDISVGGATTLSDRFKELAQGAIAPEVVFIFPTPDGEKEGVTPPAALPVCLVGLETCGAGIANPPVRTYWRQRGAN